MRRSSAGLLMFRRRGQELEVFLVHPGGPFWQKKDMGAWSIPKGECLDGEDALTAAKREFEEETRVKPEGEFLPLGSVTQAGGKVVTAWALEGDCSTAIRSNAFSMEWPPKSGQKREFPEVDRANWFPLDEARRRINKGQIEFLERLLARFQHTQPRKKDDKRLR
jgi:predicted NUDIX family NTP pyrophosphohydrolase